MTGASNDNSALKLQDISIPSVYDLGWWVSLIAKLSSTLHPSASFPSVAVLDLVFT